jgi:NADH-quinone oxidoreductase subunit H
MSPSAEIFVRMAVTLALLLTFAPLLVWVERRVLGRFQLRRGPNRVGPFGILQTVADAIKLLTKEDWVPPFADPVPYVVAPMILAVTVLGAFAVIPFSDAGAIIDLDIGVLFFLAMSSIGVYSVMLAGLASNSKYSLLGAVRSAAQMISYELAMGLSLASVVLLAGSFNLRDIVAAQQGAPYVLVQPLAFLVFLVAGLAELKRAPFDLPEAENEIVAGFHTEYSSMKFALFFLGEYLGMMLVGAIATTAFLGGGNGPWLPAPVWFALKVALFIYLFIWIRATLPRFRYDHLMAFGWKFLLPVALINLMVTGAVVVAAAGGS